MTSSLICIPQEDSLMLESVQSACSFLFDAVTLANPFVPTNIASVPMYADKLLPFRRSTDPDLEDDFGLLITKLKSGSPFQTKKTTEQQPQELVLDSSRETKNSVSVCKTNFHLTRYRLVSCLTHLMKV